MIDISDGLASDLMQICRSSLCGARIYLERMPIARQCSQLGEQMHIDPITAALNGGEDYELLFTLPLEMREKVASIGCIDIIGHITEPQTGCFLVTPDGGEIELRAQGFVKHLS
jgi:thiamine-monophosphate kinase